MANLRRISFGTHICTLPLLESLELAKNGTLAEPQNPSQIHVHINSSLPKLFPVFLDIAPLFLNNTSTSASESLEVLLTSTMTSCSGFIFKVL